MITTLLLITLQDFSQVQAIRELQWVTQRARPSPDRAWILVDQGVCRTKDWSINSEASLLRDLLPTRHPDSLLAITPDAIWIYSAKTFRAAYPAGLPGRFVTGDISPNGKIVIGCTSEKDSLVVASDWEQGPRLIETRKTDVVTFLAFVRKEQFISVARDGTVALWNPRRPDPIKTYRLEKPGPCATTLSIDAKAIFVLAGDGLHRITTHDLHDTAVAIDGTRLELSSTGRYLATFSETSPIEIWKADTLETAGKIGGKELTARSVAFSPDDRWLLIGNARANRIHIFAGPAWEPTAEIDLLSEPRRLIVGLNASWIFAATPLKTFVFAVPKK